MQSFIDWIAFNKCYAKSTVESYTRMLKKFDSYLKELTLWKRWIEDTGQIVLHDVESFISLQKIRWLSARTCNLYLACIRDFLDYASRGGEDVINYKQICLMKEQRKKVEALSENEAQKLLFYMKSDTSKDELTKTRDYAIVNILLYTWLRVSELCNIKLEDIKRELQIIGKNQTVRLVYLFQDCIAIIQLYLFLREWKHINSEYLFCSHASNSKWHKLTRAAVEMIVRNAGVKAGLTNPVWPHKLRHTFATSILRRWGSIYYIKELLWHQNITTTQTYLTATNRDLRETQKLLLGNWRGVDWLEEPLSPMPENIIVKDNALFNQFRNWFSIFQNQIERGVPSQVWYNIGYNF